MGLRKAYGRAAAAAAIVMAAAASIGCATTEAAEPLPLDRYAKPGFVVMEEDGRLWVFREGSEALAQFREAGAPAEQVIRPLAAPDGVTIKAADGATIDEYLTTLPGFYTQMMDGRLWVFRADSAELAEFRRTGEPAKQVARPLAGPFGLTIKAVETAVIDDYMAAWEAAAAQ